MCLRHEYLDWKKYIDGDVADREEYEEALTACPDCLQEYISLLGDVLEAPAPGFADSVMAKLTCGSGSRYSAFKPLFHYLVAACLTLVLIELGAFDWMGSRQFAANSDFLTPLLEGLNNVIGTLKTNLGGM